MKKYSKDFTTTSYKDKYNEYLTNHFKEFTPLTYEEFLEQMIWETEQKNRTLKLLCHSLLLTQK